MPNINTKFSLSGEKEYKAAISQIGDGMRVLNSEMRKVESEYAKNADSVEALTKVNDVLERKIYSQTEKIETLKAALQTSAEKYGVADKRTMAWQASLNNAEAELNKMNDELAKNNAELDKAGASGSKFQQAMEKVKDSVAKAKEEGTGAKGVFANLKEAFSEGKGEAVGLGDAIGGAADKLGIQLPEGATKALNSLNGINA